jgi:hypothetical protein
MKTILATYIVAEGRIVADTLPEVGDVLEVREYERAGGATVVELSHDNQFPYIRLLWTKHVPANEVEYSSSVKE